MTNRKLEYWVIPPEADAEFVACMEEVLETYEKPYDAACPVLCMDEQPVQLTKEVRQPIPATKRHLKRVDYEYERAFTRQCVADRRFGSLTTLQSELRAWSTDVNKRQCPR